MKTDPQTTAKHPLEEDVTLDDGTMVRVTGLLAVQFRKDPEAVRRFIAECQERRP
jgi:hypothetical protein